MREERGFEMNYKKEISVSKIKQEAADLYGDFYCSEAIVSTLIKNLEIDIPAEVIAMASGFPGGIGGSKCLCGAVSGGLMTMGLFFGRTQPKDEKIGKMMTLSAELHDWFKAETGKNTLCCRVLTRGMEWEGVEHRKQCADYTGMVAERVLEILIRELDLVNIDEVEEAVQEKEVVLA